VLLTSSNIAKTSGAETKWNDAIVKERGSHYFCHVCAPGNGKDSSGMSSEQFGMLKHANHWAMNKRAL